MLTHPLCTTSHCILIYMLYTCVYIPLPVATIDEVSVYYVIRYYTVSVQIYCH